ncbi:MAG TPA: hypothetical protein DHW42_00970 [Candidatus Marinimicrobia bacterium]|nr:hypothetical protein [Candidatus Neomarinimicrobiota bacterium]
MKKLLMLVAVVAISTLVAFGQWQVVKEQTTDFQAGSGYFLDANNGWIAGNYAYEGQVLKTTDGGANWDLIQAAEPGIEWNDIEFFDANVGYACAEDGYVFKTTDGGANWTMIGDTANVTVDLEGISVVSADVVYICGQGWTVLKTINGGASFTVLGDSTTFLGEDLDGNIAFADENKGVVIADGTGGNTWYTTDGGSTWNYVSVAGLFPIGTSSTRIYDVEMIGSTVLIGGYYYTTFISTDGGANYTLGNVPVNYGYERFSSVNMVDAQTFFASGTDGVTYASTDGGANWTELLTGTGQQTVFVDFADANTGYIIGYYGMFMKTTDGGASFTPLLDWPQVSFWGLAFPETDKIVLSTYAGGELATSTDGGATWDYPSNLATEVTENLYECEFFDANTGLAGGGYGTLIRTTDGGDTWTAIESPMALVANKHINAIHVYDATTAFAGGSSGYLMKSVDGGLTWTDTKVNSSTVYDIWALDANTVLASESSGKFCYGVFDASGAVVTDSLLIDVGSNAMRAIEVRNNIAIIPASSGKIFRAALDRLDTLASVFTDPDGDDLYDVEFVNDTLVFVVGEAGKIYRSDDAGLTWTAEVNPSAETLQKVRFRNNKLWAVGKGGTILLLDMTPEVPYELPISEAATDGTFDLKWDYNEAAGIGTLEIIDSTASAWGSHVVAFTDSGYTGIAHVKNAVFQDYTISADVYLIGPADPDAPLYAGITIKTAHEDLNYYRFIYRNSSSSDNGILKLQGYDGASWHISKSWYPGTDFDTLETGWHNMKITVVGNDFYAFIDGKVLPGCPYHDEAPFLTEGYPGIFKYNTGVSTILFDNFSVTEPEATPVEITFEVDMSVWANKSKFNIASDFVDIAGNFNGWDGAGSILDDADGDSVYSITILDLYPEENLEYKFRINGSWDEATCEFPSGGPNRTYVVPDTNSVVFHWYNDEEPEVGIIGSETLPKAYALRQNYPNPFNPTTTISFDLPEAANVKLVVYNMMGQQVAELKNENMQPGFYKMNFNASHLASGVYIYRIQANNFTSLKKMTILK